MREAGEIIHWLLFFFVFGGLAILFLTHPQQTNQLMNTIVSTGIGGTSSIMKNYVSGVAPQ